MASFYIKPGALNLERWRRVIFFSCVLGCCLFLFGGCSWTGQTPREEASAAGSPPETGGPEALMERGKRSFRRGAFEKAISNWEAAGRLFAREANVAKQADALIRLSRAHQSAGQHEKALSVLETARGLAEASGDQALLASAMGQTGNVYISVGQAEAAHRFLTEGLKMAKASGDLELAAAIFNNLGNL
ncbi:MAG: tetratricopeptide repeat protein, partial [Desulfobacterales bacterium]|nr:tetratricopeptide repeat protein [Desulfobacterales bacterium]